MATLSNGTNNENNSTNGLKTNESAPGTASQDILVVGSLGSAKDSTYYSVVSNLQGNVDKYLIDRILEGG